MSSSIRRLPDKLQFVFAGLAGITGAWFLIFLGNLIPELYGFTPIVHRGELLMMFALFGLAFGFYLGRAMTTRLQSFFFITSAFLWVFLSLLINFPPIFYGQAEANALISLVLPFIFAVSTILSGVLPRRTVTEKAFEVFCSRVTLYLFWIHVGYVYMYPMFLKLASEPISALSPNTLYFVLIVAGWLLMVFIIFVTTQRLERLELERLARLARVSD